MKPDVPAEASESFYLPDFCTSRATLAVVLIVELTALVLTLARDGIAMGFWTDLGRTSLFLLWIGLASAALLCWMGRRLRNTSAERGSALVLVAMTALVAAISAAAAALGHSELVETAGAGSLFPAGFLPFLARNVAITFVVTALALRYFYVTHQWRRNVEMQARARVHALQARIRPHFLFNSMNTIAALTRSNPARAEQAVHDLADLFRVSLAEQLNTITLEQELEVARTYQRMEQLRLGDRLHVSWNVGALPLHALVPGLTLQPLLENAIYHGIEPSTAGGTITVNGELSGELITIVVRNAVPDRVSAREGNRLALANIRERMQLMYGERALVKAGRFDAEYIVTLRFPYVESRERLTA
ncbi:MAG TPA: histidine kinase [Steroidobacteraceae bacterium]|nr:histidine kinase [Steroidobacteraceae bacterium]